MFYRKIKLNEKWYPRTVIIGKHDTDEVARRLALMSTVSKADTMAVLAGLGDVLGQMMAEGKSVYLEGLGTFMLTGLARGNGVDTSEEVNGDQFTEVRVRFIPEYERDQFHRVTRRTIVPLHGIEWIEDCREKTLRRQAAKAAQ